MVAMSHFSQYVGINDPSTNIVYKLFSSQGGYLGVAVFFFLSGYGLMESEQRHHLDIASFLKKRFLKVYLPVVLVTALWIPVFYCILNPTSMDQETVGGGIWLIVSDLLFNFKDGVLWFVKILFMLYISFYLFALLWQHHEIRIYAWILLSSSVIIIYWLADQWIGYYAPLSVPLFGLGVFASIYKDVSWKYFNITFIPLLFCAIVTVLVTGLNALALHALINYCTIGCMLILFTRYRLTIPGTVLFGAVSFDIYLVHDKVLMGMKAEMANGSLLCFVGLTLIATILFYLLRTKILKV